MESPSHIFGIDFQVMIDENFWSNIKLGDFITLVHDYNIHSIHIKKEKPT